MSKISIKIPDSAHIRYSTPTKTAGKYNRDRNSLLYFKTEAEARHFAAGSQGNGSGKIYKHINFRQYLNLKEHGYAGSVEHKLEQELKPVTKFTKEGKQNHKRYLELVKCKHKHTRVNTYGAGCQKDYEKVCTKCNEVVG